MLVTLPSASSVLCFCQVFSFEHYDNLWEEGHLFPGKCEDRSLNISLRLYYSMDINLIHNWPKLDKELNSRCHHYTFDERTSIQKWTKNSYLTDTIIRLIKEFQQVQKFVHQTYNGVSEIRAFCSFVYVNVWLIVNLVNIHRVIKIFIINVFFFFAGVISYVDLCKKY